jgi:protein subunit release factor B
LAAFLLIASTSSQNKTNSAVQLKHIPTGIVIKSQATRSRSQNRKIARDLLAAKLDELYNGAQSRSAIVSEVKKKRAASAAKKSRRKYRKLAEEKAAAGPETDGEPADTDEEMEAEVLIARDDPRHVPAQAQVTNTKNQT